MAEGAKTSMPARRKARKRALDVLYEADMRDKPATEVLIGYLDRIDRPLPEHVGYTTLLVEGVGKNLDRIDELIVDSIYGRRFDPVLTKGLVHCARCLSSCERTGAMKVRTALPARSGSPEAMASTICACIGASGSGKSPPNVAWMVSAIAAVKKS